MQTTTLTNVIILIVLSLFLLPIKGQNTSMNLTLEDIYKNRKYGQEGYGPVRWMKNNKGYSILEMVRETVRRDIVKYDAETGQRSVLISSKQLIPGGETTSLRIADYIWSEDNLKLLIFTNTRRVWRYHTKGDYWVLNMNTGILQ